MFLRIREDKMSCRTFFALQPTKITEKGSKVNEPVFFSGLFPFTLVSPLAISQNTLLALKEYPVNEKGLNQR